MADATKPIPTISLNLSFDGIALMRRENTTWIETDRATLVSDSLDADIAALREAAQTLAKGDAKVQLFIPTEQIKFVTFQNDPNWDRIELLENIIRQLEGSTPYELNELRYDFKTKDDTVYVAATAIETLKEAEDFVKSYGFIPLGVAAHPDADVFPDYPYFGLAADPVGLMTPVTRLPQNATTPVDKKTAPAIFSTKRFDKRNDPAPTVDDTQSTLIAATPVDIDQAAGSLSTTDTDEPSPVALFFSRRKAAIDKSPPKAPIVALPKHRAPSADLRDDAQRLTMFGKRVGQLGQDRGFSAPRALIAAVFLFICVAGGAVAYFLSKSPEADTEMTQVIPPESTIPDAPVELSLPPNDPSVPTDPAQDLDNVELALEPETPEDINTGVVYTPQELQRIYAATGIWPSDPVAPQIDDPLPLGNIYLASIDPSVAIQDAIALYAQPSSVNDRYTPHTFPPAPSGTIFELDPQGLVKAVPEGALSPEGHMVYLGKPARVPPAFPEKQKADDPVIETIKSLLASSGTPLIDIKPRSRPDTNTADIQAQANNDALKLVRPRPMPAALEDLAIDTTSTQTDDVANLETGLDEVLKPKARPKNLDTTSKTKSASVQPDPQTTTSKAPNIPTNAKVSKEATIKNALKLNQINLLGVYGTGSKKRALVRFSNGRRQMVSVGDKLDGGKVAAIGDTELRYIKGGRDVILKLPKG